jgi:hypothetical protein
VKIETMDDQIRAIDPRKRPSMHPHSRHKTQAGPARHVLIGRYPDGRVVGRLYVGMRKFGYVEIELLDYHKALSIASALKISRYAKDKYARDIQNALFDAWRC